MLSWIEHEKTFKIYNLGARYSFYITSLHAVKCYMLFHGLLIYFKLFACCEMPHAFSWSADLFQTLCMLWNATCFFMVCWFISNSLHAVKCYMLFHGLLIYFKIFACCEMPHAFSSSADLFQNLCMLWNAAFFLIVCWFISKSLHAVKCCILFNRVLIYFKIFACCEMLHSF